MGPIAYAALSTTAGTVFTWLQALSGLAALFTWGSICLAHIRFRQAWRHNGHGVDELPFRTPFGEAGSWVGLGLIVLVLIAQFYTALYPVSGDAPSAEAFFQSYLAVPVVLGFYVAGFAWKRQGPWKTAEIDIDTGLRQHDWEAIRKRNEVVKSWPWWRRTAHFFF